MTPRAPGHTSRPQLPRLVLAGLALTGLAVTRGAVLPRRGAPRRRSSAPAGIPEPPELAEAPPPAAAPSDDPATSFTPARATRWLAPGLLLQSAVRVVISGVLGQYTDKREAMGALPADDALDCSTGDELWLDYVSDCGDGFDATYAMARVLAEPERELRCAGTSYRTRRGELLVMGGDQCYPSADIHDYEDKVVGPYRAALPMVDEAQAPRLLVIPGNHDWYDGLTAFMRTFCQRRWIGGWRTCQSRSYFTVKLPGRWWLWGIDIQFDTYIDDVQRRHFERMAEQLEPGDAVILCSAKPSWVAANEDDLEAYATLDYLERTLIIPRGAKLRIAISGDRHHYLRYAHDDGRQKLTAGGGGAYLSSTHHLPKRIVVPPEGSRARGKSASAAYLRQGVFPSPEQSSRLAWGVLSLPWRTPSFTALLGCTQVLLSLALAATLGPPARGLAAQLRGMAGALREARPAQLAPALVAGLPSLTLSLLVVGSAVAFTKKARTPRGVAAGSVHGLLHLALAVGTTYTAAWACRGLPGSWLLVGALPLVAVAGGVAAALLVASYLIVADRIGLNSNELFAAQAIPDYKNMLRLRFDRDGAVTIFPIGLSRVPRAWRTVGTAASDRPRFEPEGQQLDPVLIEAPIWVSRTPGPDATSAAAPAGAPTGTRAAEEHG